MNRNFRNVLLYIGVPLVLILGIVAVLRNTQKEEEKQYYEIVSYFYEDQVTEYELTLSNGKLNYKLLKDQKQDDRPCDPG